MKKENNTTSNKEDISLSEEKLFRRVTNKMLRVENRKFILTKRTINQRKGLQKLLIVSFHPIN